MKRLAAVLGIVVAAGCGGPAAERPAAEEANAPSPEKKTAAAEPAAEPAAKPEPRRAEPAAAGGNAADPGEPAPPDPGPAPDDRVAGLPEVVAEVDGEPVTRDRFLRAAVEWWGRETLEEIILRRVVEKAVQRYGVSIKPAELEARVDAEFKAREAEVKQKYALTIEQFLKEFGKTPEQFRQELRTNENLLRQMTLEYMIAFAYLTEPRVHLRHIQVASREKADELRRRIQEGADFAMLAKQESDDEFSADRGGELREFIRGMSRLGDDFEDVAFALQKEGDVSTVVKTERGFHVLKLIRRTPATPQTFDSLREQVVKARMDRGVFDMWMKRLRREYAREVKYLAPELAPREGAGPK